MTWRNPPALLAIRADADRVAPGRSHASDGTIGDASHGASVSDHNPAPDGDVHAIDITNDPAHGMDGWKWAQTVADRIKAGQETRVKYLVSNNGNVDVIFNPTVSMSWRQNGSAKQDHRSHLHVSILYTEKAEQDTSPFFVGGGAPTTPPPVAPPTLAEAIHQLKEHFGSGPVLQYGNRGPFVRDLQFAIMCLFNTERMPSDGEFGTQTRKAVQRVQTFAGLKADGIVGARTRRWVAQALRNKFA